MMATGTVAVAFIGPVSALFVHTVAGTGSRLQIPPVPGGDLGFVWTAAVQLPADTQKQAIGTLTTVLLCSAVAMLAVAVVTFVALSVAQHAERNEEIALHRAVGASRGIVFGAALVEGVMLTAGALIMGRALGVVIADRALDTWPGTIIAGSSVVTTVAIAALVVALLVGTLFPAAFPSNPMHGNLANTPTPLGPGAVQLGVSLAALTTGALMTHHATALSATSTHRQNGSIYSIALPRSALADRAARYTQLLNALGARGHDSVSLTSPGVLTGLGPVSTVTTDCGLCAENGMWLRWRIKPVTYQFVSADTFRLLNLRVLAGRGLDSRDAWNTARVAVVSRNLALREFQNGEALGRNIQTALGDADLSTVVGVVDDPKPIGLGASRQPLYTVYLSVLQHPPTSVQLLVRPRPARSAAPSRPLLTAQLGRSAVVSTGVATSDFLAKEAAPVRWFGSWIAVEGWAMLGLAMIGVIVLMEMWIRSQLVELGVRRAVGARRRHLLTFVLLRALGMGVGGTVFGLWFGSTVWSVLPTLVPGLRPWDPSLATRFSLLLVGTALAGAMLPAYRVVRRTPVDLILHTRSG